MAFLKWRGAGAALAARKIGAAYLALCAAGFKRNPAQLSYSLAV
ncbi:MAG: hypothetical protein ACRED5_18850 [Propylenella sp.]